MAHWVGKRRHQLACLPVQRWTRSVHSRAVRRSYQPNIVTPSFTTTARYSHCASHRSWSCSSGQVSSSSSSSWASSTIARSTIAHRTSCRMVSSDLFMYLAAYWLYTALSGEDDHYGQPHKQTLSLRDVPGMTRAAIPLLHRRNISAVSVGENSQVSLAASFFHSLSQYWDYVSSIEFSLRVIRANYRSSCAC